MIQQRELHPFLSQINWWKGMSMEKNSVLEELEKEFEQSVKSGDNINKTRKRSKITSNQGFLLYISLKSTSLLFQSSFSDSVRNAGIPFFISPIFPGQISFGAPEINVFNGE